MANGWVSGKWVAACKSTGHQFMIDTLKDQGYEWHGPPRDTEREANNDREEHIDYYKSEIGLNRHDCIVFELRDEDSLRQPNPTPDLSNPGGGWTSNDIGGGGDDSGTA